MAKSTVAASQNLYERGDGTLSAESATVYAPIGITGASAGSRYVGGTASGAPASGTFAVGDFAVDQSGTIWICTVAGSPGTWVGLDSLALTQTVTGQKTFTGTGTTPSGHWLGSVVADQLTVQPGTISPGNASLYLDNNTGSPQVWEFFCDGSGNWGVYDKTNSHSAITLAPSTVALTLSGLVSHGAGTTTASSAPVITGIGATSGNPTQLTDTTRDYMVYFTVTTAGTATSLSIGHTNTAADVTLKSSTAANAGDVWAFRLPAGWYLKWTGTTTAVGNQVAVGC